MRSQILLQKRMLLTVAVILSFTVARAQLCIPPVITIQPVGSSVCVGGVSLFTVVAIGTSLNYQWQVNNGSGFTNCANGSVYSGALTATLHVTGSAALNGSNYRCIVSNSCGSNTSSMCLLTIPFVSAACTPSVICDGASATLTASGGVSYLWSTGATTATCVVTPATTTTYTLTGTTLLGCTNTTSITVTVNPKPNVTVSASPSSVCAGSSSVLTASGANTYQWSTGQTGSTITVTPGTTTTYSVTGTNSIGCSKTVSVTVTVNPLPNVSISGPGSICSGGSVVLTASGAATYQWSTGQTGSSITVSPTATQTYSVVGTSSFGCTRSASKTVSVNPTPSVTVNASPPSVCAGSSSVLTASGANTYQWSTGQTGSTITVTPGTTTTYSVTGTNNYGCSASASKTVIVNPSPVVSVSATDPDLCPGGFTFLTASGATNYLWSTGETGSQIGVSPSATTTYDVTGTDGNGCSSTVQFTVTVTGLDVTITATNPNLCPGGFTFLTASGATNYYWSTGETGSQIGVSPTETTIYGVTGLDDAGCSGAAQITVTVDPVVVTATATNPELCPGGFTWLNASGASTYLWSTGETGPQIGVSPTETNTYVVTGTSEYGCSSSAAVTVQVVYCPPGSGGRMAQPEKDTPKANADEAIDTNLAVYPNPTTGILHIQGSPDGSIADVFNSHGQRVMTTGTGEGEINIAQHAKGIYFIKVSHQGALIFQTRVLKE